MYFSFDEVGYYEVPANIDHILNITGLETISYVGFSQGATVFFMMGTTRPEYNDKVNIMIGLAPTVYAGNLSQPLLKLVSQNIGFLDTLQNDFDVHEIIPHRKIYSEIINNMFKAGEIRQELCAAFLFSLAGYDSPQMDRSFIPVIATHDPAGMSLKQMQHFVQGIISGEFKKYDYGRIKNLEIYKQDLPPSYNISHITTPVALYHDQNDLFAAVKDVERFAEEVPNLVLKKLIEYKFFNHLDFMWATDVDTMLNNDVIKLLNDYNTKKIIN